MADINLDFFLGSGETFTHREKDTILKKDDENLDWISDDFLDSILESCPEGNISSFNPFLSADTEPLNPFYIESSSDSSDVSRGLNCSPGRPLDIENDLCLNDALLETKALIGDVDELELPKDEVVTVSDDACQVVSFDSIDFVKEEEVECEEVFDPSYLIETDSTDVGHDFIQEANTSDDDSNASANSLSDSGEEPRKMVRDLTSRKKSWTSSNYSNADRVLKRKRTSEVLEGNTSDDSDTIYPRLNLTPEEQKLATKEGIKLPSHYPLTKIEERELKRIRRKIRNKISAQDSRRRKKEYVDGLEERVKRTSDENADLMKRIKTLETQKLSLIAQVKKLQATLARCSGQTAPSSTCLLVFVMSLALILAPNLRNTTVSSENTDDEGISLSEEGQSAPSSPGHSSRNLLSAQKNHEEQTNFTEEAKMLSEQLEKMQLPDSNVLMNVMEMLKLGKTDSLLKDHDYFRPRKRLASELLGDESWPSPKMLAMMASEMKNIAGTLVIDEKGEQRTKEPVIIDLISD